MASIADERPKVPKAPRISHVFACLLELGIVATLIQHRAWLGLLLCVLYAWYSACWALFRKEDER